MMKFEPTLHKLSNGLTVILDPMDLETVNIEVFFNTGSRDETPKEQGITHFCEHMFNKGTARFPDHKTRNDYLDYNGGTINASTANSYVNYYGRILSENLNILIDFIADELQNSLFLPEKIDIERKVISDELRRAMDSPDRQIFAFISEKVFNDATSSYKKTLGNFENINSFTREQMLEFLSRRLSVKNCIICISGKINNIDDTLKFLEKSFIFLPIHNVENNTDIKYNPGVYHNSQSDKKNVKIRILFPDIYDYTLETRYQRMCVGRFERFMIKKLNEVIRHENGLVYGFGDFCVGNEKFGTSGFATETSPENIEKIIALIAKNSYKIYNENAITNEDLDRFLRRNKLGDADWLESAGKRGTKLIDFYRDYKCLYDFYDTIKMSEKVNRDDVIKYSRGYFDGQMSIITQGADFDLDLKAIWEENFK